MRGRRPSFSRLTFEALVGVVALAATLLVNVSIAHLTDKPEKKAEVRQLDPAVLRSASKTNHCTAGEVALTFDDGPDAYTEPILDVLHAYGVDATFFVLGSKAGQHQQTIEKAVRDGHLIENHTWDHPHLADLTEAEVDAQVVRTQEAVRAAGAPAPTMLRAPFNNQNDTVRAVAARHGLRLTSWDIDTNDYRGRRSEDIARAVVAQAHPGAVVLLHDGIEDSSNTLRALPAIIEGIRSRGYCTTTLA